MSIPPSWIQAASTVILVIVTGAYVIQTKNLVDETREARKREVMPILNLDLEPYAIGVMGPKVENIGNGPAVELDATIQLKPDGEKYSITSKNIASGDFAGSLEPEVGIEAHEDYSELSIEGTCKDVYREEHPVKDDFNLELLANKDGAESMMNRDEKIRHLRKIESNLEEISRSIEMDGLETYLTIQNRGSILDILHEESPLTVGEICQETGLIPLEVKAVLQWLDEAGAVEYDSDDIFRSAEEDLEVRLSRQTETE
jgi:predicted transcriptional regulator